MYNNTITKGESKMSKATNNSKVVKISRVSRIKKQTILAADDVRRIARRRPSLYQTKIVPQVTVRMNIFNGLQNGGTA